MTAPICEYDDCENEVCEEDYCEECACYICEEHNGNIMNLAANHALEDHWSEE
jgi:hypothetical protein